MNTNKLKKFAQETRRKLLKQVNGKLEHVLNTDSSELRGKAQTLKELKKELDTLGREALVDKVAYTWFNRLVALRYMDARDFQPLEMAILTPQEGQVSPQILQEAMAGHIPGDLKVNTQQVMDILDGRTSSSNPENEAYRLILVASCNHLHSIFPFLFESIDDYTELLLPDDLTSEFSIVQDVIDGMTNEDCQQVEILGWLYQFYISEKKDEVFASKGKVKKEEIPAATQLFTPRWIVEYMVQNTVGKLWVLNHPNSRLKEHMEYYIESEVTSEDVLTIDKPEELTLLDQACGSGHILVYGFELLYKIYEEEGYAPSDIPRLIIEHNLHGFEIDERAAQLAGLAILMKAREKQQRLFRKSEVPEPNITCFEDLTLNDREIKATLKSAGVETSDELFHDLQNMQQATNFGSLIVPHAAMLDIQKAKEACMQAMDTADLFEKEKLEQLSFALDTLERLGTKVSCVVDNPPYMGIKKMNKSLSNYVKDKYSISKSDLMTCFMLRAQDNVQDDGLISMINMPSWMFISSYEDFRKLILKQMRIDSLLHLGRGIFGSDFGTVSFVLHNNSNTNIKGIYRRLFEKHVQVRKPDVIRKLFLQQELGFYDRTQEDFEKIPGSPIGYWVSSDLLKTFEKNQSIADHYEISCGLFTCNNTMFIRYWWEVSHNKIRNNEGESGKWAIHAKGAKGERWSKQYDTIIDYSRDGNKISEYRKLKGQSASLPGSDHYFKEGVTFPLVTAGAFSAALLPNNGTFDISSNSAFKKEGRSNKILLSLMSSQLMAEYLKILSPTLNFSPGDVGKAPFLESKLELKKEEIVGKVDSAIEITNESINSFETSKNFKKLGVLNKQNSLKDGIQSFTSFWYEKTFELLEIEISNEKILHDSYSIDSINIDKRINHITIDRNIFNEETDTPLIGLSGKNVSLLIEELISYAVGCMFGRYSLDQEGLILANQGETLEDYFEKVFGETHPSIPSQEGKFIPDDDNIIPVLDDEWFEDDIVFRFHEFLKASFGEDHFQKNLSFVEEQLGYEIRKYFDKHFYNDHIKRYNKRPIYWKFSSPKGHFSVLIYMHRYTPDTLNNILNNYLREFVNKLKTRKEQMQHLENTGSASEKAQASKEIDKLNEMIADCQTYEREILYPLASERIAMDLDDGVLVNYNLFGKAVEEIKSVNDKAKKKKVKEFDWIDGERIR